MNKINHVKRMEKEAGDREFYYDLVDRAAGAKEAEALLEKSVARLEALGVSEDDATDLLVEYGSAMQEKGFNGGFDLGFSEGGLLGVYGSKVS